VRSAAQNVSAPIDAKSSRVAPDSMRPGQANAQAIGTFMSGVPSCASTD
jgi:hypothetical protein